MTIQHKEMQDEGMFFIADSEDVVAQIVYTKNGNNTLVIEHTEVERELRGNDIGYELVHRIVEYALENGMRISPVCPFAKAVFDKNPDWTELLA